MKNRIAMAIWFYIFCQLFLAQSILQYYNFMSYKGQYSRAETATTRIPS